MWLTGRLRYIRTNVVLTVNGTNYPATISGAALGYFTFNTSDRGRMEQVDLTVSAPGIGPTTPAFASSPRIVGGKFQLTVNGTIGQSYTVQGSTNLVNWTAITSFVSTAT